MFVDTTGKSSGRRPEHFCVCFMLACVFLYVCIYIYIYTFILHASLLDSNTTCNCVFFLHFMTTDYSIYRLVLQLLGYFWSL